METDLSHEEIKRLLIENSALVRENNALIKKMYRATIFGFIAHLLWYVLLIALPLILYFVFEPYFEAAKASLGHVTNIPGVKQFIEAFESYKH